METRDAIEHFGTAVALAKSLGITRQSISRWGEKVPPRRAFEIERLTDGKLKADFTPPTLA
ncbi:Cro/CI family transcriptional regulator [Vibrio barjaei]|uniref:Cro/CI family transcriptional regulator n=1 Tax=Vibrio barjaei TaxID=1676683 RepID=UPI0007BC2EA6|nr:Cro/CI family transcriptional regulator [Vibrio barjaei]OIN27402.1 Cro/Cl family transcriptional regulator [Vibrio barjaei]